MKKLVILVITLGVIAVVGGYYWANSKTSSNNITLKTKATSSNVSNQNQSNANANANANNDNKAISNNQNSVGTTSDVTSTDASTASNQNNITTTNNIVNNIVNNQNNTGSTLNVSQEFTPEQISAVKAIAKSQKVEPGAGIPVPIINLDYYSIVNGQKYYAIYQNTLNGTNWYMAGTAPFQHDGNYSNVQFLGYFDASGQKISKLQFMNGNKSFDINNTSNLSNTEIQNMLRKIAIIYVECFGFDKSYITINTNELTDYNGNISININNTKEIDGQTYYEVEFVSGEPFYISLSGNIYVAQEHYLAKIFNMIPAESNAQIEQEQKHA